MSLHNNMKAAVWHNHLQERASIVRAVESLGFISCILGQDGEELVSLAKSQCKLDLIVCGMQLGGRNATDCLLQIAECRAIPAIIISEEGDLSQVKDALKNHVMAFLMQPVREVELKSTIFLVLHRFEQYKGLTSEVEDLKEALETRKLIERAKAVIMRKNDIDEESAYQQLRKLAMDQRVKMVVAAEKVLTSQMVLDKRVVQ